MTIPVVCPHCDSTFQLSPDLAGKAMRCPNPDCREVFTVAAAGPPPAPPPPAPVAPTTSRDVAAVVSVVEGERPYERVETSPFTVIPEADPDGGLPAMTAARLEAARSLTPPRIKSRPLELDPFTLLPDADPDGGLPAAPAAPLPPAVKLPPSAPKRPAPPAKPKPPAGPKEKVWSGDAPPPPKPGPTTADWPPAPSVAAPTVAAEDDEPVAFVRTKRPKTRRGSGLLVGSVVALVLAGGLGGFWLLRYQAKAEDRTYETARDAYKDANYPFAKTQFEGLTTGYPTSRRADEYKFFTALSGLRAQVGSVTLKDDPGPAVKAFDAFAAEWGAHPLAQPESGYASDILEAGKRLADGVADHGEGKLKAFRDDRTKRAELDAAEATAKTGLDLVPRAEKFRDKQSGGLDAARGRYEGLVKGVADELHRLEVLAPYRDLESNPTADRIAVFQQVLKDNKLDADKEATDILDRAERALWRLIGYSPSKQPAGPPTADGPPPVLVSVAPADRPEPSPPAGAVPGVAFAVARGVLVALDRDTGRPRWGVRVAPPTADPQALDLPTRLGVGDGEWVLVAGQTGDKPTLTARQADTGQVVWQQVLDAPAAGRAVVVAGRVYLPLRDPLGTVAEFDVASGSRTGQMQLRQPVGAGIAVGPGGRPGQFHLFVPGDGKRVFVFEVGREDAVGRRLPPRPVRALLTDHPKGSLRCEPVLSGGGEDEPRTLILCQADAPTVMKVRAFLLPKAKEWADGTASPADQPTARPSELTLPGWAWTAPVADGERLLLATDAPAVLAFGLQQPGTLDRTLFALPGPRPAADQQGVSRSQVVAADEDGCWAVLAGLLQRLAVKVDPVGGLALAPAGPGVPVGEPLHRAQAGGGQAVIVTRSGQAGAVQATSFDLLDGRVRWQRRLGLLPAGPAVASAAGAVLADEDGSVYLLPDGATAAVPLAAPYPTADGKAVTVAGGDGAVWVLAAGTKPDARQLRVRRVAGGQLTDDRTVPLPDEFAGQPVGFGADVLVPLRNGTIYRLAPGADRLVAGPRWAGTVGLAEGGAVSHLQPVGPDEFVATDGGRLWLHWRWPAGDKAEKVAGPYSAADPLAAAPVRLDTPAGPRFVAVDTTGAVGLFDPARLTAPVRRWTADTGLPPGKPTDRPAVAGGRVVVAFDRRVLVGLDPEADGVAWTVEAATADAGELAGWRVEGGKLIATDLTGRVAVYDAATGKPTAEVPAPPGGPQAAAPQAAGLVVYTDGTAGRVPLP